MKKLSPSQLLHFCGGDALPENTCAFKDPDGWVFCNISKVEALFFYDAHGAGSGANWCCDSCSDASWWQAACGS